MAEVLVEFSEPVGGGDGRTYIARACGTESAAGTWLGWIEFIGDDGTVIASSRETTQPNRQDTVYWATGLTPVYLEGALERTLKPLVRPVARPPVPPFTDGPAPDSTPEPARVESILDPFSVYRKGEALLRTQLGALSAWHLVNIINDYQLSQEPPAVLSALTQPALAELIVAAVRARAEELAQR
ncbi:MAG: hypothetical protein A3H96_08445 [Acidobacteria bacterium RIFCSPLOWO2_02_FULL_67_36]|nr:MAG: hypothetical protein A3H96_08445 [Acidobacteria bacterium RIFCSPLOWO2_02_FULL_67_36]OFW22287.1 MAG: hypothetical protein A3G21_01725 [Acidobacteria bacterium RIFCSPLOWO2_12_FULL_66_21]